MAPDYLQTQNTTIFYPESDYKEQGSAVKRKRADHLQVQPFKWLSKDEFTDNKMPLKATPLGECIFSTNDDSTSVVRDFPELKAVTTRRLAIILMMVSGWGLSTRHYRLKQCKGGTEWEWLAQEAAGWGENHFGQPNQGFPREGFVPPWVIGT